MDRYEVSKATWEDCFDLVKIATQANFRMDAAMTSSDWHGSYSFDSGKMLITGIGLSGLPYSTSVEQKDYAYIQVKSITGNMMCYDEYFYWNGWTVSEFNVQLDEFFRGFGIFRLNYSSFTYDSRLHMYTGVLPDYGYRTYVGFEDNRLSMIMYDAGEVEYQEVLYYTFSDYGRVKVTLPTVTQ